ncbi:hypothetical protein [Paenarthrobacter sp. NPDC089316]|uniref:hypothetical protein n=1 Tax=unclassified Paenarthrobacter TaxID=2634190 RepID=UPI00342D8646
MRPQNRRRPRSALFLALMIGVISVACSGPKATPPPPPTETLPVVDRSVAAGVRASLNELTGEVVLPMDNYWYSDRENVLVNSAVAYLIDDCVRAAGRTMVAWGGNGRALQDFRYGQWSRPLAARNGNVPETRVIPGIREKEAIEVTPADQQMYEKCTSSVGRAGFPELLAGLAGDTSLQNRMVQTAAALTERDPEYLEYRKAWESCITTKGLKLAAEGSWAVKTTGSKEDEIRTVLLDLGCKDASGGARVPYDIFAQYEAAQMKDHQAELNELASQKAAAVDRAKQVLRDHGVADARL